MESNKAKRVLSSIISKSYNNCKTIDFVLDSIATVHTCYIKESFTSIKSLKSLTGNSPQVYAGPCAPWRPAHR